MRLCWTANGTASRYLRRLICRRFIPRKNLTRSGGLKTAMIRFRPNGICLTTATGWRSGASAIHFTILIFMSSASPIKNLHGAGAIRRKFQIRTAAGTSRFRVEKYFFCRLFPINTASLNFISAGGSVAILGLSLIIRPATKFKSQTRRRLHRNRKFHRPINRLNQTA